MKTLPEIKDEVARKEGHSDWMTCCFRENLTSMELIMDQVTKLFAQEACREQREICAAAVTPEIVDEYDAERIKNAPEPTLS